MFMYISKLFETNIGATMHLNAIKEIAGKDEIFIIDLRLGEVRRDSNYIAYGKYKSRVERIRRYFQGNMMFISNEIINEVCSIIKEKKIHTVFIEDSVFGNLVKEIKEKTENVRVCTFYHDIKADLYLQWIKTKKRLIDKIDFRIGIRQEWINQKYSDCNIVFNERDAALFEKYYGRRPEKMMALPAPTPIFENSRNIEDNTDSVKKLLFVGKNYYPNIVGLKWFYEKVLPGLDGDFELQIVGRGLEYLAEEMNDRRANVIGEVDSLDEYYRDADIVIIPLFDGGGMKSKTVEAISYGKTIIGTDEGLVGFWDALTDGVRGKSVFLCNTPEEWIKVLNNLIGERTRKWNPELFELFLREFSYESSVGKLRAILFD